MAGIKTACNSGCLVYSLSSQKEQNGELINNDTLYFNAHFGSVASFLF